MDRPSLTLAPNASLRCPLCGTRFTLDQTYGSACRGCPLEALKGSCGFAKCPHCGYDVLLTSHPAATSRARRVFRWVLGKLQRRRTTGEDA